MLRMKLTLTLKILCLFVYCALIHANDDDDRFAPCKITTDQAKVFVNLNKSVTLSCHARGCHISNIGWTRSSNIAISDEMVNTSRINDTHVVTTLHITRATHEDETDYFCNVRKDVDESALVISNAQHLYIRDVPTVDVTFVEVIGAHLIYFEWRVNACNSPVTNYLIQYTRQGTGQWRNYSGILLAQQSVILGELRKSIFYQFRIRATNSIGNSQFAYSEWVTTFEKDPEYDPNIRIEATTLHSITFGWTPPPAKLKRYMDFFKLWLTRNGTRKLQIDVSITEKSHVFENLKPMTSYGCELVAYIINFNQFGNWSAEKEAVTMDRDPKFIPSVSIEATTLDSIRIGWTAPPQDLQSRVHQYKVWMNHLKVAEVLHYVNATENSYVFKNLNSTTSYQFKVAACGEYKTQCAHWSTEREALTIDRDPKFIPDVLIKEMTADSITMEWSMPPPEMRDRVHQFKVTMTNSSGYTRPPDYLDKTENSYVFGNLKSETSYLLKVAACGEYRTQCANWSTEKEAFTREKGNGEIQYAMWSSLIVAFVLLVVMFTWMTILKRRELAARRRFIEATLERFNTGAIDCLNPEMLVCLQAEFLPYDNNLEVSRKRLKLGKVLGSGAFGIVRRAVLTSITRPKRVTTVAVKMVQATAKFHCMTALSRELKILAHLGKHLNVVNLIGACTDKVAYGELWVIVEFCRFGNLHDYLLHRRDDFVDKLDASTDGTRPSNSGMNTAGSDSPSTTGDRGQNEDSAEADQRIKYQGDYVDQKLPPICTRDLFCWAWQVSRGMEYLSSRRIVHGDLAARNILIADNNVVKICDFGLSRALYADDIYEKKGHDPLPISLAETPYPGIEQDNVYQKISKGFRMDQPKYATETTYRMMLQCWHSEPSKRPSFRELEESIADLLAESIKTHYIELGAPYAEINAVALASGKPDYLTMNSPEGASRTNTAEPSLD